MRPRTVGELAAQLGVPLEELVKRPLFGSLAPDAPFFATFRWDIHHEAPVTTAEDLDVASCCPTTAGRSTTTSRAWGSRPCARWPRAATIEFNPPVPALELAALLGVSDPVARTVGVHMSSWEVELGDAVATLEGSANGETYSLPAALGARVVAQDRVRFIRARGIGCTMIDRPCDRTLQSGVASVGAVVLRGASCD